MAGLLCECAFLCSYAYENGLSPAEFRPACQYAWRWHSVYPAMSDWKRFSSADSDAQVLFAHRESDRTSFLVFRGTDSLKDALINAAISKLEPAFMSDTDPSARVHAGFYAQFRTTVPVVHEYLDRHEDRTRVVVTGHSLGGAVATLCAALLRDELGEPNVECVVFGCPRVGNAAFVRRVDELVRVQRVIVGSDPVPRVPSRVRWCHAGDPVLYVDGCRVNCAPGDPLTNVFSLPNLFCVSDHRTTSYIDAVSSLEPPREASLAASLHLTGLVILMLLAGASFV